MSYLKDHFVAPSHYLLCGSSHVRGCFSRILVSSTVPPHLFIMFTKHFYLLGEDTSVLEIPFDALCDYETLRQKVAAYFAIVQPSGMARQIIPRAF
jgi:hypothetical protein